MVFNLWWQAYSNIWKLLTECCGLLLSLIKNKRCFYSLFYCINQLLCWFLNFFPRHSSTKEFADTISLAKHAFTSNRVGYRYEHLGFHKALCVLMGWNHTGGPNGLWALDVLPSTEALSLKEDLIIWPPVVLIHNSSLSNYNLSERIIVSIEGLKDILSGE